MIGTPRIANGERNDSEGGWLQRVRILEEFLLLRR